MERKGMQLDKLLTQAQEIHEQMRVIFLKNRLTTPELKNLSDADREQWYKLKSIADKLGEEMCKIIKD